MQLEKSPHSSEDPAQPKINQLYFKNPQFGNKNAEWCSQKKKKTQKSVPPQLQYQGQQPFLGAWGTQAWQSPKVCQHFPQSLRLWLAFSRHSDGATPELPDTGSGHEAVPEFPGALT